MIGDNIRALREKKGMKQAELAKALGISTVTLSRYENGVRMPRATDISALAAVFGVSVSELMTEPLTPNPPEHNSNARADAAKSSGQIIRVPVYGPEAAACCGNGFGDMEPAPAAEEYIDIPAGFLGPIDPERLPFIIYASGDSMIDAGIADGSQVIINPADSVLDGDAALVDFAMNPVAHSIAVKRVYWLDDGAVEIRSACGDGWKRTFTRDDAAEKSIRIIGKVEWVGHKPRRG